ncbi:Protein-lysine N-methyltransferase EFM4 [Pleurostoma richardsiae]|uniref:Protein-lysine N-methyltransferase EFM4 n=1 Tax=Pleurostoma richardsiae TaxID=41990 RepID=A0AA38VIT6_9PEZI|nr:Protein-lysine N-methyltransferase EFM4 [Pleurostoma richardsiae]
MADTTSKPTHLEPSQLGTKEYWDALYSTELTNHASNPADTGTVWFDDSDAEAKLLAFLDRHSDDPQEEEEDDEEEEEEEEEERGDQARIAPISRAAASFLDLGCGNGSLLLALRGAGWGGRMLGVDYSAQSVALARRVAAQWTPDTDAGDDDEGTIAAGAATGADGDTRAGTDVEFAEWDVLAGAYPSVLNGAQEAGWDVVLDKGTFDAISLSEERDSATGRRICEGYRARVVRLVRPGGLLLITSCNWTEAELKAWFEGGGDGEAEGGRFEHVGRVEYPSFSFGGVKGQTISTLCFARKI